MRDENLTLQREQGTWVKRCSNSFVAFKMNVSDATAGDWIVAIISITVFQFSNISDKCLTLCIVFVQYEFMATTAHELSTVSTGQGQLSIRVSRSITGVNLVFSRRCCMVWTVVVWCWPIKRCCAARGGLLYINEKKPKRNNNWLLLVVCCFFFFGSNLHKKCFFPTKWLLAQKQHVESVGQPCCFLGALRLTLLAIVQNLGD